MSVLDRRKVANAWLRTLSPEDFTALASHLEHVSFERGDVLVPSDEVPEYIYFPEGGIGSIVLEASDLPQTEVGIFGREGMSGMSALLGAGPSANKTYVQIGGSGALRIPFEAMRTVMDGSATLRANFSSFVHVMLTQMAYNVVTNARYALEARLARWLLMCHDRLDGDELRLTHDFMAIMIGAQRTGVTVTLHQLEGNGAIRSKRGLVIIQDRERLEDFAGNAYGYPEEEYRRLIGDFGRTPGLTDGAR